MNDHRQRRALLFVVITSSAFIPIMASGVNIALPAIGRAFHLDAVLMSWIATSYILSSAVFVLPFGRLADIFGRKKIFSYGLLLFLLASLAAALAPAILWLLSARVLQGLGSAMMFANGVAMLTSAFPPGERGRALGLNVAAVYLGLSVGPVFGGLLTQRFGWRSIFVFVVPFCLAILFVLHKYLLYEWTESPDERFDVPGSLLLAAAMSGLLYGFSILPQPRGFAIMAGGLLGLLLFIRRQKRITHPLVDLELFTQNRAFTLSNLAALINYGATTAVVFIVSLYLQYIKGLPPRTAGLLLMAQPLVQAVTSPLAGRLSDRMEPRYPATIGMMLTVVGLLLMSSVNSDSSLLTIVGCLLILGLGFGLFSSPNTNAIMSSVSKRHYGAASSMVSAMRLLGQMFSMGLTALVLNTLVGRRVIVPELYGRFIDSMHFILWTAAGLCCMGVIASMSRGKIR